MQRKTNSLISLLVLLAATACGKAPAPCAKAPEGDIVYVVKSGWHAELGIPVSQLDGDMVYFKDAFPGASVIMFGYGKKTFFTGPPGSFKEYVLGPFPGPAVIHAVGLNVTPPEAYPDESTVTLALPPGGSHALSAFIAEDLVRDASGNPKVVSHSNNPDGVFYAADSEYNLLHTCNSWAADALHSARLPVSEHDVIFSSGVMDQVQEAAKSQCEALLTGGH